MSVKSLLKWLFHHEEHVSNHTGKPLKKYKFYCPYEAYSWESDEPFSCCPLCGSGFHYSKKQK